MVPVAAAKTFSLQAVTMAFSLFSYWESLMLRRILAKWSDAPLSTSIVKLSALGENPFYHCQLPAPLYANPLSKLSSKLRDDFSPTSVGGGLNAQHDTAEPV